MTDDSRAEGTPVRRVGLLVTCLVDLYRPNVGFATIRLLEQAGCAVEVPLLQTCCGQPAFNSGDFATAARIAEQVIAAFEGYEHVVVPSGSCAGMVIKDYPRLFEDRPDRQARAEKLAAKTRELFRFLTETCGMTGVSARYDGKVTYHDSCSGMRQLGIKQQPRQLLQSVKGLQICEMADTEVCCGFGGTFCVKYPDISGRMVSDKAGNVVASGADTVLGGDLGCLLNIAGRLTRSGYDIRVYHAAEVLAGMTDTPSIGRGEDN